MGKKEKVAIRNLQVGLKTTKIVNKYGSYFVILMEY
jgi:hypothetical protein